MAQETVSLLSNFQFLVGLIFIGGFIYYSESKSQIAQAPSPTEVRVETPQGRGIFQIPTNDPTVDLKNTLIPIKTQGRKSDFTYKKVGTVYTEDPTEDSVYLLEGRHHPYNNDRWQYRVLTTSGSTIGNYSIPIQLNEGKAMKELYTGDSVKIRGKESLGNFIVEIDDPDPLFRTLY
jgi:hypothetical protein